MMPGEVRVTVAKTCPAGCKEGRRQVKVIGQTRAQHRFRDGGECPTCHGRGVVDEPVSCAGCRWFDDPACMVKHERFPEDAIPLVDPDHACKSWAPLMDVSEPRS